MLKRHINLRPILRLSHRNAYEHRAARIRPPMHSDTAHFFPDSAVREGSGRGARAACRRRCRPRTGAAAASCAPPRPSPRRAGASAASAAPRAAGASPWMTPACRAAGMISLGLMRARSSLGRRGNHLQGPLGSADDVAWPCCPLRRSARSRILQCGRSARAPYAFRHVGVRTRQGAGVALAVAYMCNCHGRASLTLVARSMLTLSG